jgi:hypothetical protein
MAVPSADSVIKTAAAYARSNAKATFFQSSTGNEPMRFFVYLLREPAGEAPKFFSPNQAEFTSERRKVRMSPK